MKKYEPKYLRTMAQQRVIDAAEAEKRAAAEAKRKEAEAERKKIAREQKIAAAEKARALREAQREQKERKHQKSPASQREQTPLPPRKPVQKQSGPPEGTLSERRPSAPNHIPGNSAQPNQSQPARRGKPVPPRAPRKSPSTRNKPRKKRGKTLGGDGEETRLKDFFDLVSPSVLSFFLDHYIVGSTFRCAWVIRDYPITTEHQALLAHLADRGGVTVRIYNRAVEHGEQDRIIRNAQRKNKLQSSEHDITRAVEAETNLQLVMQMLASLTGRDEKLLHTAVFLELKARSLDALHILQSEILGELTRAGITVDKLLMRQKEGFLSTTPFGANQFGAQFERVLPVSSVANLSPLHFSGKTDPQGQYIGRDTYGSNVLVDFDRRAADKTNAQILILGNSGRGKSYLLKLILFSVREAGKTVVVFDPEAEYEDVTMALGGSYIDFMEGTYIINPLEPREWSVEREETDMEAPPSFRRATRLSRHIAYLKDFFRAYKDFSDAHLDTIEILLTKLYGEFGITDQTDYTGFKPTDYPVMADFYQLCDREFQSYDPAQKSLYTAQILREVRLGIYSMCVGTESKYFNGHTNIKDSQFLCFGVKGLLDTNQRLKDAMLFNILSYMTGILLGKGNAVASIDELYLFLSNRTAIEYIRNASKRVRKKNSALILASQNIEDFLIPEVREMTKPLFSIPTHQFLFHPGEISAREYCDALQLESAEYALIRTADRGHCLYRCGKERYFLQVIAPEYKQAAFGSAGGK